MEPIVYIDGQYLPKKDAKISVFDHGLLYGDGIFEGIRTYGGRVFKLDRHLERLYRSAGMISLEVPLGQADFRDVILEVCRRNEVQEGYIRPIVTRGAGTLGLDPRRTERPTVIVIATTLAPLYEEKAEQGLRLITSKWRRNPPQALNPNIKSLNYLNNILAMLEVIEKGMDEAVMLDMDGFVSEGSADNIFIYDGSTFISPPVETNLPGVTRETAIELIRKKGWDFREEKFRMEALYSAQEVFLTGTAAEIAPVVEVDSRKIGSGKPGEKTKELTASFKELVNSTGTPIYD
ncbi:MAG: branched-chain-amino-acid transaminase [Candidatus Thermoplasmatota archaeon]|nr:branched-chain-amino-acid transaminase [Candidatus Thermoplasmatota archaeon]